MEKRRKVSVNCFLDNLANSAETERVGKVPTARQRQVCFVIVRVATIEKLISADVSGAGYTRTTGDQLKILNFTKKRVPKQASRENAVS